MPSCSVSMPNTSGEDVVELGGKLIGVERIGEDGEAIITEAPNCEVVQDDAGIAVGGHVFRMH